MDYQLLDIWQATLDQIEEKMSKPSFETWLKTTKPVSINDDSLVISVPNEFTKDWVQGRYADLITSALQEVVGNENFRVHFVTPPVNEDEQTIFTQEETVTSPPAAPVHSVPLSTAWLNPKYTFDTFVIGNSNRFAHAAALAVSEAPARAYNPLFIYGGVGLGKTHLMHAIGHHVINNTPSYRVMYLSSESLQTNLLIPFVIIKPRPSAINTVPLMCS